MSVQSVLLMKFACVIAICVCILLFLAVLAFVGCKLCQI